jgi:hypothetical protein
MQLVRDALSLRKKCVILLLNHFAIKKNFPGIVHNRKNIQSVMQAAQVIKIFFAGSAVNGPVLYGNLFACNVY